MSSTGIKKSVSDEWFIEGDEGAHTEEPASAPPVTLSASNSSSKLNSSPQTFQSKNSRSNLSRSQSQELKQMTISTGALSLSKGITSSPSFQELEKAIGAQLAMGLTPEEVSNAGKRGPGRGNSYANVGPNHHHRAFYNQQPPEPTLTAEEKLARTRNELKPFVNEIESRAMILFHSPMTPAISIKNTFQKFGVLNYFRQEFHSRGVTFLCYFDLRHAINAFSAVGEDVTVEARYSSPLQQTGGNATKASEESILVASGIPDIENSWNKTSVESVFSRYGQIKGISKIAKGIDDEDGTASYTIEYFNTQDTRLAAAELAASSGEIWGADSSVKIVFAPMEPRKQHLSVQLLAILSRWRVELGQQRAHDSRASAFTANPYSSYSPPRVQQMMPMPFYPYDMNIYMDVTGVPMQYPTHYGMQMPMQMPMYRQMFYPSALGDGGAGIKYGVGSNGQPQYASGDNAAYPPAFDRPHVHGGQPFHRAGYPYDWQAAQHRAPARAANGLQRGGVGQGAYDSRPLHHTGVAATRAARHGGSGDGEFALNVEQLARGDDARTTLMVRNIPNKYSQTMLLEEINLNHSGTYDFFYLPIDFKNKCNVGYCFINFLEPSCILPFVKEFNGQGWKSFNSEKVCAVTFARIQGKAAMVSRFQNSSLLDKDDEYRPLLFYSSGALKGHAEPFPLATKASKFDDVSGGQVKL